MIVALVDSIRNCPIIKKRCKYFADGYQYGGYASHIEKSFLLASKRCSGEILGGGR